VRWCRFTLPNRRRSVLILPATRSWGEMTVAPSTTTFRDIPSEVFLTRDDGLPRDCAVNCDHLQTVSKAKVGAMLVTLSPAEMEEVAEAVSFALALCCAPRSGRTDCFPAPEVCRRSLPPPCATILRLESANFLHWSRTPPPATEIRGAPQSTLRGSSASSPPPSFDRRPHNEAGNTKAAPLGLSPKKAAVGAP
jgi:mRNA interferase MazF